MPLGGASSRLVHPRFLDMVQQSAVGDAGLPDECTITRAGDGPGTTGADGSWTPPAPVTVYGPAGGCRAQSTSGGARTVIVGDDVISLGDYLVAIEADADEVLVDDVVTVTTSGDPDLQGRRLIVRHVHHSSFLARRLLVCDGHPDQEV